MGAGVIMGLPTLSEQEADKQLEASQQIYDQEREILRTQEEQAREAADTAGTPEIYNPVIWDEWQQIRYDEYRKRNDAIREMSQRARGIKVNARISDAPWYLCYGRIRLAGVVTFLSTDQLAGGDFLHVGYTLAGHEIEEIEKVYVNGEEVSWNTDLSPSTWGAPGTKWENIIFISCRTLGAHTTANSDLMSQSDALFPGLWTSNHIQRGRAFVYMIFKFDNEVFASGFPVVEFLIKGNNQIYDPREDTTGWSQNAALIIAHHLTNAEYGYGLSWSDIDSDNLEEQADICDESVTVKSGGTESRYSINCALMTSENRRSQMAQLLTSCGAVLTYSGGKCRLHTASWPTTAGDLHLTEEDTISGLTINLMPTRGSRFNRVTGRYVSASDGYVIKEFPAVTNQYYLAEDSNIENALDVLLPCTTSRSTAQRLAKIELERIRQGIDVSAQFSMKAYQAQVGDVIKLSNDSLGWSEKYFEVYYSQLVLGGSGGNPTFLVSLGLRETASGVFDWDNGEETDEDLAPNTNLPDPSVVENPSGLTLESGTSHLFIGTDGTIHSRIYASWNTIIDPFVLNGGFVEISYKRSSASSWVSATSVPGNQSFAYLPEVQDNQLYDVRVRAKNNVNIVSDWVVANSHLVIGKTEAPSDVVGLIAQVVSYGISISWDAITDLDRSQYEIRINGTSWDDATFLIRTSANIYLWQMQQAGTYTIRIKSIDTSRNYSTNATNTTLVIASPLAPADFVATIEDENIKLSWSDAITGSYDIDHYDIYYGDSTPSTFLIGTKASSYSYKVNWGGVRVFGVAAIDVAGNIGAYSYCTVDIVAPGVVNNLRGKVVDNNVMLDWQSPTVTMLPIIAYDIYKGSDGTDNFSSSSLTGSVNASFATLFEVVPDDYVYWVLARDSAGNEGKEKSIPLTVSAPPNLVLYDDQTIDPEIATTTNCLMSISDEVVTLFDANIYDDLVLWLDANQPETKYSLISGNRVALLQDRSAASNDIVQSDTDKQPFVSGRSSIGNYLKYSNDFSQSVWNKDQVTITSDYTSSPLGAGKASLLKVNATASNQYNIGQELEDVSPIRQGAMYSVSILLKRANWNYVFVGISEIPVDSASSNNGVTINLETNETENFADVGTISNVNVSTLSENWIKLIFDLEPPSAGDNPFGLIISLVDSINSDSTIAWTPSGEEGVLISGSQIDIANNNIVYVDNTSLLKISGINNRYSILITGNDVLIEDDDTIGTAANTTIIVVFNLLFGTGYLLSNSNISLTTGWDFFISENGYLGYSSFQAADSQEILSSEHVPIAAGETHIAVLKKTGTNVILFLDGVEVGSGVITEPDTSAEKVRLGGSKLGGNINGYLSEALIFNSALSNDNIQAINNYLNYKWLQSASIENDLSDTQFIAPVEVEETYEEHFGTYTSFSAFEEAGYSHYIHPTVTSGTFEHIIDYGTEISSAIVTAIWNEEMRFGDIDTDCTLSYSDDAATWTDVENTTMLATDFRYVKIHLDMTAADDKAFVVISNINVKVQIKRETDEGAAVISAVDTDGTEITFNKTFSIVENISMTPNVSFAARFREADGNYMQVSDCADLSAGNTDFTIAGWCNLSQITGSANIIAKWGASNAEYALQYIASADAFRFYVSSNGTTSSYVTDTAYDPVSANEWYFVVGQHNAGSDYIYIKVNDGTRVYTAYSSGVYDGTASFKIGYNGDATYLDGLVRNVGFWREMFDADDLDELYYYGLCRYSELPAKYKTNCKGFWELRESASGVILKTDASGNSHDLTKDVSSTFLDVSACYDFDSAETDPTNFKGLLFTNGLIRVSGDVSWKASGVIK